MISNSKPIQMSIILHRILVFNFGIHFLTEFVHSFILSNSFIVGYEEVLNWIRLQFGKPSNWYDKVAFLKFSVVPYLLQFFIVEFDYFANVGYFVFIQRNLFQIG